VLDRVWRIAAIGAFAVAVFWFGHRNSPLAPPAQATVYETFGAGMAGIPSVWELRVDPGEVQVASLNGNQIFYTVEDDWRSVSEVLDYYEQLYSVKPVNLGGDNPRYPAVEGVDWPAVRDIMNQQATSRAVRMENDLFGIYGAVVLPDPREPGFNEEMERRSEAFGETGRISDFGDAKFVMAMRSPSAGETTVMTAWPSPDFDVRAVATDGTRDAPGHDPADIPRASGDVRLLSFDQDRPEMSIQMAQYQQRMSEQDALDFYSSHLPQYDWAEDTRIGASGSGPTSSALFTRGRQQCHVSARWDGESQSTVSTVVVTGPPGSLAF